VTTPQGSVTVKEGNMITIRGVDNPEYKVVDAPSTDDWDRFNKDRDNVIRNANSWGKTNSYYTGTHDLDAYGRWVYVPGYGDVWQPYQQAAWAPYQAGRWVWEPYWGWTWVSYEPWGWAPYHYGRWFYYGASWVWWPGPIYPRYRPVWAPAFVTFIGFGRGVSVGVGFGGGFGHIGWLPCGRHDYFYPWYGGGFNRVNVVNATNINVRNVTAINGAVAPLGHRGLHEYSNVNMALTNERVRGSITTVESRDFGTGHMNNRRFGVDAGEFRQASMMTANVPVVPTRESLHAGGGAGVPAQVQARSNERFFTRHQPPAGPASFNDQAAQVRQVVHGGGNPDNGGSPGRSGNRMGGPTGVDSNAAAGGRMNGNEGNKTFGNRGGDANITTG